MMVGLILLVVAAIIGAFALENGDRSSALLSDSPAAAQPWQEPIGAFAEFAMKPQETWRGVLSDGAGGRSADSVRRELRAGGLADRCWTIPPSAGEKLRPSVAIGAPVF
jgi:hypothetical protein